MAAEVDPLFAFMLWLSVFFFGLILGLLVLFIIRYRKRPGHEQYHGEIHNPVLEVAWIVIPTIIVLVIFFWGFKGYLRMSVVPAGAMEIKVTGQKWFWSFDYPEGATTVNELVAPVGRPVRLLMSSKDVIHSLFVPVFRMKHDVLPNRYSVMWFEATRTGEFNLFCTEYCGSKHSQMIGKVRILSPEDYRNWIEAASDLGAGLSPAEFGAKLYQLKACNTCHTIDGKPGNGPTFLGIFGHEVTLADGRRVTVDENYIRESVLNPATKVVGGFQPIMPTYQGILKDREIDAVVAYIKSLAPGGGEH